MFEIAPNKFILKSKILGMKLINKDDKHWVVFQLDSAQKDEKSAFSDAFASAEEAKQFLENCAAKLV